MNYIIHRDKDYLEHHGVEGQKWGRRRYQNEDGSYKPGAEGRYDPDPDYEKARNKSQEHNFKGAGKDEWDEIQRRADEKRKERLASGYKYKTKNHRQEDESDAEDDMIREHKEKKKAAKEKEKEKKLSKDSYKKVVLRGMLRGFGTRAASAAAWYGASKLGANYDNATAISKGVYNTARLYNYVKTGKEAYDLHQYRKKKSAKHSDYSDYELYHHGILGMHWGIRRFQNEDESLTEEGKRRYIKK